jgi:hypothetical protein
MQAIAWAVLFRSIPQSLIGALIVRTVSGMEVTIQDLLRVDHEMVILRGRLAGSQDQGRLYFIPYASIDSLGSMNLVRDEEYQEMFGSLELPRAAAPQVLAATQAPPPAKAELAEIPAAEDPALAAANGPAGRPPVRSEVLERFRARQGTNGASPAEEAP